MLNKNLKKLNIKLPYEIGKLHYISKLPTKQDFQKLVFFKIVLFILFCVALYMMNDYMQDYFHQPHYKQLNDGRIVDIEPNIFIIYSIIAIYTLVKIFTHSFKLYIVGDKGCCVFSFKSKKNYSLKIKLFSDIDFSIKKSLDEFKDNDYKKILTQMYNYFLTRRKKSNS